jgi:hypothetical protein
VHRVEFAPFPSIEEAEAYDFTPEEAEHMANRQSKQILGTQDTVARQLADLAERAGAEECRATR